MAHASPHDDTLLLLGAADLEALMAPADYLRAVTEAFRQLAHDGATQPPPLSLEVAQGGFHAKAAAIGTGAAARVALKFNANFPGNPSRHGLPTIQGLLLLCDGDDGRPLALMDSAALTIGRTAAASALAARHLARPQSQRLMVFGCGAQAFAQVRALAQVLPIGRVSLHDLRAEAASALARRVAEALQFDARALADAGAAAACAREADVIVTCTPSRRALLQLEDVAPGCFVAAVGADNPHKQEIGAALMARATVVVDSLAQCALMGDLHHALAAGALRADQVHAELADVVALRRPGRTRDDEVTLFDSTGLAVQDAACALVAFSRARERGVGMAWRRLGASATPGSG